MSLNITKCRLCLKLGKFFSIYSKDTNVQFAQMITELTEIKITGDDGLPDTICHECIQKLSNAYLFKQQCERSDRHLRNHLNPVETLGISKNQSDISNTNFSKDPKPNSSNTSNTPIIDLNNSNSEDNGNFQPPSRKRLNPDHSDSFVATAPPFLPPQDQIVDEIPTVQDIEVLPPDFEGQPYLTLQTVLKLPPTLSARIPPKNGNKRRTFNIDQNSRLRCGTCKKVFRADVMLNKHMFACIAAPPVITVDGPDRHRLSFRNCDICDARFTSIVNLHNHIKTVHIGRKETMMETGSYVLCKDCNYQFIDLLAFVLHYNVCPRKQNPQSFMCPLCACFLKGKNVYLTHVKNAHFTAPQASTNCQLCLKNLMTPRSLKQHLDKHKNGTLQYRRVIYMTR